MKQLDLTEWLTVFFAIYGALSFIDDIHGMLLRL